MIKNKSNKKEMKKQALYMLKTLGANNSCIKDLKNNILNKSKNNSLVSITDEEKSFIKELEKEYGIYIYHIIETKIYNFQMKNYLYVSRYKEEWERNIQLINNNCTCAYAQNLNDDDLSEFGVIGIKNNNGSFERTN